MYSEIKMSGHPLGQQATPSSKIAIPLIPHSSYNIMRAYFNGFVYDIFNQNLGLRKVIIFI